MSLGVRRDCSIAEDFGHWDLIQNEHFCLSRHCTETDGPSLLSLTALEVVMVVTCSDASSGKVGTIIT